MGKEGVDFVVSLGREQDQEEDQVDYQAKELLPGRSVGIAKFQFLD